MNRIAQTLLWTGLLTAAPLAAQPLDQEAPSPAALQAMAAERLEPAPVGGQTRRWLELQRSGAAASEHSQALPPSVAARTHQRYLDSFEQPMPQQLLRDDEFGTGR